MSTESRVPLRNNLGQCGKCVLGQPYSNAACDSDFWSRNKTVADMFIDHFLCREFQQLFRQELHIVAADILHRVARYRPHFPDAFARTFAWLDTEQILSRYGDRAVLTRAFAGIARRLRQGDILTTATAVLAANDAAFADKAVQAFFQVRRESIAQFLRDEV